MGEQKYKPIELISNRKTYADISDVKLLDSEIKTYVNEFGTFEERDLKLILGIECIASACEEMTSVELADCQRSLDNMLNPTDFYYRVNTEWELGCVTGSYGNPQFLELELKEHIDQRKVEEKAEPWAKPSPDRYGSVHHLSFYSGMLGGFQTWAMYKLDMRDIKNVTLEFVKRYSYVQGESIDDFNI